MSYAYYNGIFAQKENVRIPLSDRAITFGDGVYDVCIGRNLKPYLLDEHIERIIKNAKRIGITNIPTAAELENLIYLTVKKSGIKDFLVYFQLTRNLDFREHSAKKCNKTNILITVEPFELQNKTKDARLILRKDLRYYLCDIKTINLLPAVIASTEADELLCDETVFERDGIITECAHSNIAIIKDGALITHPADNLILPGITRRHLLLLCDLLGIPAKEIAFTVDELFSADEVIITSTTKLMRRVSEIDGIKVGFKNQRLFSVLDSALREEFLVFLRKAEKI